MPSQFERYRMRDGQTQLAEAYFNPVWKDIDARLAGLEGVRTDWETAIASLQAFGLARIDAQISGALADVSTMVQQVQAALAGIPDIATTTDLAQAIAHHTENADPHPQYLGGKHVTDPDPHGQYLTSARHTGIRGNPHGTTAADVGAEPALSNPLGSAMVLHSSSAGARYWDQPRPASFFEKADFGSVCFAKTGASTLAIKAGTKVMVGGNLISFAVQTAVVMPTLTAGTDYAVYVCTDGTARADASFTAPAGYTTANSRKVGGFHYGLVAPGTTPASGWFNTAAPANPGTGSMVWTQSDVDLIAGINAYSLWDLKWKPSCPDPRGMVLVAGLFWCDIYLCNTDTSANGTSKAGATIARGTAGAYPKVPAAWGGNGASTYITMLWETANELGIAAGKRLLTYIEFAAAAWGVTEQMSGASVPSVTARANGFTSKYGLEQATGQVRIWGADIAGVDHASASAPAARGNVSSSARAALMGGAAGDGAAAGSQHCEWGTDFMSQAASIGARYRADHVVLF